MSVDRRRSVVAGECFRGGVRHQDLRPISTSPVRHQDLRRVHPAFWSPPSPQSATKIYGVCILLSEALYMLLSLKVKHRCRKLDIVSLAKKVQGLYSFPIKEPHLPMEPTPLFHPLGEVLKPEGLEVSPDSIEETEFLFLVDRDLLGIQHSLPGFDPTQEESVRELQRELQRRAFCHYTVGNWASHAKALYEELLSDCSENEIRRGTQAVYDYMAGFDFAAPADWREKYRGEL